MLKMAVGKHHTASNNITNSMDKNVTYNHSFHFTAFYPMGPVRHATALLDLSSARNNIFSQKAVVWTNERWCKILVWNEMMGIYWSLLSTSMFMFFVVGFEEIFQNLLILKISENSGRGARPDFSRISLFRCMHRIQRPQNAVYWMVRERNFEKV